MFATVTISMSLLSVISAAGIGKAWDISPSRASPEETTVPAWPRLDLSAFEVRSISGIGHLPTREYIPTKTISTPIESNKNFINEADDMANSDIPEVLYDHPVFKGIFKQSSGDVEMLPGPWEKSRKRGRTGRNRGYCPESLEEDEVQSVNHPRLRRSAAEVPMEKISATKNVREPRLDSPESWSSQPLSVEFRHHTNFDGVTDDDDNTRSSAVKHHQSPQVDFVTASRRSFDTRESRDLPSSRSFDDGYRNVNGLPYTRDYYYPDQIRTEREYFIRGLNDANYSPDRYRIEDFDMYRNRPTPKPKRIIYYATLPEVVRKPIDLRTYPRPYDSMGRATSSMSRDGIYRRMPNVDSRYRYRNYPYDGYDTYDNYMKRSGYTDRNYAPYHERIDDDRFRELDLDHASFKEAPKDEELNGEHRRRPQDKLPWPVQIGTEINIKDNTRVTGRKIFGDHRMDFDRFRPSKRIEREENGDNSAMNN